MAEGSSSSTVTVTYEEHCQNHGYPLPLVRGATSVLEGAGNCPFLNFACFARALLGVFYVSVRGVRPSRAIESMTLDCQELLDSSVSRDSFAVVRVLDSRSPGVLLRVASLELKHRILGCKDVLKCRGLVVGLA